MEEWRDVIGLEGYYQVSSIGKVRSLDRIITDSMGRKRKWIGKTLTPNRTKFGYVKAVLRFSGDSKTSLVHRLVAECFIPNPDKKETVNHKNGIKHDNRVENLEWATRSEQHIHAFRVLKVRPNKPWLGKSGYDNHSSKEVIKIKNGKEVGRFGSAKQAAKYTGVNYSCITSVCRGERKYAGGFNWRYTN